MLFNLTSLKPFSELNSSQAFFPSFVSFFLLCLLFNQFPHLYMFCSISLLPSFPFSTSFFLQENNWLIILQLISSERSQSRFTEIPPHFSSFPTLAVSCCIRSHIFNARYYFSHSRSLSPSLSPPTPSAGSSVATLALAAASVTSWMREGECESGYGGFWATRWTVGSFALLLRMKMFSTPPPCLCLGNRPLPPCWSVWPASLCKYALFQCVRALHRELPV